MASGEKQPSQEPTSDTAIEIRKLFEQCAHREKEVSPANYTKLRDLLIRQLSFGAPLFPPAPKLESNDLLVWQGHLHQALVTLLRKARDDDTFWYVLAQWIKSEGLREPDDFLPADVFGRLTKKSKAGLKRFPWTDYYSVRVVRLWLPYTEPLLRKTAWLRQHSGGGLARLLRSFGYDSAAVELVLSKRWRSAVEFTCEWLAQRGSVRATKQTKNPDQAGALRNAYSRVLGKRVLRHLITCYFCDKPAEREFWAYGSSVPHCKEHGADQLPTSEAHSWTDHVGCRWWREDYKLRFKPPVVPKQPA